MKNLFRVEPLSEEKKYELTKEFVDTYVVNKIDDVKKISVTHLTIGLEKFLSEKYNLPIHVTISEAFKVLYTVMIEIGYTYNGRSSKIRFNDHTKKELEYDRIVKALNIEKQIVAIDQHRYFEKI